jgi:hypothetical protein
MLVDGLQLAGFQVSITGRFWVSTEAGIAILKKLVPSALRRNSSTTLLSSSFFSSYAVRNDSIVCESVFARRKG